VSVDRATRIMLRPIGNPLPLGFLALAAATLVVSGLQLEWLAPADGRDVALILIAFVFPLQLVTSVFGYLARDVVAGTGMGVLAGAWLSIGLVMLTSPPGSVSVLCALAVYAALAMALEDARRETILPLGRRAAGRTSVGGGLDDQLARLEREAAVREQL
jgi:succinate-acetate transporter protein